VRGLLLGVLVLALPALADGRLTVVFQGDNGGEVAPCG